MIDGKNSLPQLPEGWVWTKLSEISEIILGQSPPSSTYNEDGNGLPFYQGKLEFGDVYPTARKWCSSPKKIAERRDVLISVRAPVGPTNICPDKSCIGRGLAAIRLLDGIWSNFMLYLLRAFEDVLVGQGTGTTFNAITGNQLRTFAIPLPPLPEQHRIAAKIEELFTKLDAGVEGLKKVKAQLSRYRQAVLKYAFEGKLTEEWREAHKGQMEAASVLLERIKEERKKNVKGKLKELPRMDTSDLAELPEGWGWAVTNDVCSSVRDGTHETPKYVEEGVPLITSKNLKENSLDFTTARNISIEDHEKISIRSGVEKGDVLFAMIGTVGNPVVVQTDRIFSIKNVGLFKKNEPYLRSEYLRHWLASWVFMKILEKKELLKGTTQKFIPLEHLRILPIPAAPLSEQHQIMSEIERCFSVADAIEKDVEQSLKQAERLRQSILKRAFEGKLVPQDPTDEPAEKLLEHIRAERARIEAEKKATGKTRRS